MNTVTNPVDVLGVVPAVTPSETPVEAPASTETKNDRRRGSRKTVSADGSVSYGLKEDGTPRRKPGRRPKAS